MEEEAGRRGLGARPGRIFFVARVAQSGRTCARRRPSLCRPHVAFRWRQESGRSRWFASGPASLGARRCGSSLASSALWPGGVTGAETRREIQPACAFGWAPTGGHDARASAPPPIKTITSSSGQQLADTPAFLMHYWAISRALSAYQPTRCGSSSCSAFNKRGKLTAVIKLQVTGVPFTFWAACTSLYAPPPLALCPCLCT